MQNWLGRELDPLKDGFILLEDGAVAPNYGINSVAPESLLKVISCQCKKDCASKSCSCTKAGIPCSSFCGCGNGCSNKQVEDDEQEVNNEALEDYDREAYDVEASYNETDSDTDYEDD